MSFRCADSARERHDPMTGTAAPSRRWLLIEHPGPWAPDALAGSGIDAGVQAQLRSAAGAAGARILLVRRPGRAVRDERAGRAWAVVDHAPGVASVWGTWAEDGDLLAASLALDPEHPPSGELHPADEPVLLVCTHGRHDTCCAVRGRPVAAALAARWPQWTWECTHVGGDRFAANVVVLPDGAYYGYLDAETSVRVVEQHLAEQVDADHLRGVSTEPPVVQAAVVEALRQWGPAGARAFGSRSVSALGAGTWQVELAGSFGAGVPELVSVTVRRVLRGAEQLTCRAQVEAAVAAYEVLDARVGSAPGGTPARDGAG